MRFIDEVAVRVRGGDGGAGLVAWRRETYVPRGGPAGGDGGSGGAVIFAADPGLNTLIDFSFQPLLRAKDGGRGGTGGCAGVSGSDLVCSVPVGTQVFYGDLLVADLSLPGARWIAARGGHGGKGNAFFRSPTNQAPEYAQPGQEGEERSYRLVLKSVADVGLIGPPNVGKSTLIGAISAAHPKVADYPFTTLTPHLGVVLGRDGRRFVMADIPGLIPGAHKGKGLGHRFLQHVERTSILVQLVDVTAGEGLPMSADDALVEQRALSQIEIIEAELRAFSPDLARRPRLIAFSKADLPENRRAFELTRSVLEERLGLAPYLISSAHKLGLDELVEGIFQELERSRR